MSSAQATADEGMPARLTRLGNALDFIERLPPARAPRIVLWTVCGLFTFTLIWSLVAQLDIVAVAEGRLVPATYSKIVQPAESGVVREILVKDGDAVTAGQVLVRLDPDDRRRRQQEPRRRDRDAALDAAPHRCRTRRSRDRSEPR